MSQSPLFSAVLIVRNEAKHLAGCLESLVGVVDEMVVVDTGSTDETPDIARGYTDRVLTFAWCDDFAAARNFGLEAARGRHVLTIDADERVLEPEGARALLEAFAREASHVVGTVEIVNVTRQGEQTLEVIDHTPRLFQRQHFRYAGAIHEQIQPVQGPMTLVSTGLRLLHLGYALEPEEARAKALRNITLLQREAAARPDDEYVQYQLGKSYFSVRQHAEAARALERALELMDWSEPSQPRGVAGPVSRKVLTDAVTTLAYALANLGAYGRAREMLLEQVARGHAGVARADVPHVMGYVALMAGDLEAAQAHYEASLALGPEQEDVRGTGSFASEYHLGLLAEARQDLEAAWEHYRRSLAFKPDYEVTLRRVVDLAAEQQQLPPRAVLEAADALAFRQMYVARVAHYLENAQVGLAQALAVLSVNIDRALLLECRAAVEAFAARNAQA